MKKNRGMKKHAEKETDFFARVTGQQPVTNSKERSAGRWLPNLFFLLLVLGCIFFLLRVAPHRVDGQSMEPTLQNNDRILILKNESIQRYEMITFQPAKAKDEKYVKRVIGMPGDAIQVKGNHLYLVQGAKKDSKTGTGEPLVDGTTVFFLNESATVKLKNLTEIPEGSYFVVGDNRNHSTDSRSLGLIQEDQIEGVVFFRYFPFTKIGQPT
jgi:signal peptidase I